MFIVTGPGFLGKLFLEVLVKNQMPARRTEWFEQTSKILVFVKSLAALSVLFSRTFAILEA